MRRVVIFLAAVAALLLGRSGAAAQSAATPSDPPPPSPAPPPAAPEAKPAAKAETSQPASSKPAEQKTGDKTPAQLTVTASTQAYQSSIDRKSYSLAKDLQATTGSIADALRNIPSVSVDLQGNVSIRGDASVTILVDGKPSALFQGPSRADILQQLPADQYERVEVMTNPSAAFKADGTGGVINLITKKGRGAGFTGGVRANVATQGRYNGGVSGAYNSKALSLSGNLGIRHDDYRFDGVTTEQIPNPATGLFSGVRIAPSTTSVNTSLNASGALGYDIGPKDHLALNLQGFEGRFEQASAVTYTSQALTGPIALDYDSKGTSRDDSGFGSGSADFTHKFAGDDDQLSATASYTRLDAHSAGPLTYTYQTPVQPDLYQEITDGAVENEVDLKVEYKRPLGGGKLVTGYELQDDHQSFDHVGLLGTDAADATLSPSVTNLFKLEQAVNDLYTTYERSFGAVTVLPGLRLEEVFLDADQTTSRLRDDRSYFEAYPTLHLAYKLGPDQTLTASYSRRVQRPNAGQLNPYRIYEGPLSYQQGNADLEPQITDSYELGYEFHQKSTVYSATLYYRDNRNSVTSIVQNLGDGVLLTTYDNLGQSQNGGLELIASGRLLKTLSYNLSGDAHWNAIDASNLGFTTQQSNVTWRGKLSLNWQATAKDLAQANLQGSGPQLTPQGHFSGSTIVNLGYRHKFDDRLSAVVTVRDLFNSSQWRQVIDTPTLQQITNARFHTRTAFIGLTYALGAVSGSRPESFDFEGGGGGPH